MSRISILSLLLLANCASLPGQGRERMLAVLDQSATKFRSVAAGLEKISHTAVINDDSTERGTLRVLRSGKQFRVLIEFSEPDPRTVALAGRKAEIYYPKIQTVQEYDLGKHASLLDQFLLLGFGTSGKDLNKSYSIKILGEESVNGELTWHAELSPNSSKTREHLKRVELWIAQNGGYPVRQKFFQPSGDHTTITYSRVKLNSEVNEKSVRLVVPPGAKREFPQR